MLLCWVRKTSSFIIDGLDNKYSIKDKTNCMYLKMLCQSAYGAQWACKSAPRQRVYGA